VCLTKQQTIKWFRIINWQSKMLDKISKSNSHNWKKHKKYQYLYLQEKLRVREEKLIYTDNYDGINEYYYFKESKRLDCLNSWLDKINRKYNYA